MAPVTTPQFEPPPLPPPVAASHGDIASSVASSTPCMNCAYDLAGLLADGICPECATPIAKTLSTPRFAKAPTDYLIALKRWLDFEMYLTIFATAVAPLCALGFYAASINATKIPVALTFFTPIFLFVATSFTSVWLWYRITALTVWAGTQSAAPTSRDVVRGVGITELLALIGAVALLIASVMVEESATLAILVLAIAACYRIARFITSTILLAKLSAQETTGSADPPLRLFAWSTAVPLILFPPLGLLAVTIWHYIFLKSLRRAIAATIAKR